MELREDQALRTQIEVMLDFDIARECDTDVQLTTLQTERAGPRLVRLLETPPKSAP